MPTRAQNVRVRFAPSPTGLLHLGSFRTVLFNYLFAKQNGGVFILRIDDTDKERSRKEYEKDYLDNFAWLGITYDEFYRQSERTDLYVEALQKLIAKGLAYPCFCTKDELQAQKDNQAASGEPIRYVGHCRTLSKEKREKYMAEGRAHVYRLVVPDETVAIRDLIREDVKFDLRLVGDFIIAKSDREPLYNFTSVVDDALLGITHIVRGDDILSSTPKQVVLLRYLGAMIPKFAHIPMVVNADRSKISKRKGDNPIAEYRKLGFLPEAIVNYTALLGWHPQDDREFFTLSDLIANFSLDRVQKGSAALSDQKLVWFNRQYLVRMRPAELFDAALSYLKDSIEPVPGGVLVRGTGEQYSRETFLRIVELAKDRARHLADLKETAAFFFEKEPAYSPELLIWRNAQPSVIRGFLQKTKSALSAIPEISFKADTIKNELTKLSPNDLGLVFWPLRVALSGRKYSPPPFDIAEILGKARTLRLVDSAIKKIES